MFVMQGETHSVIKIIISEGVALWGLLGLKTADVTCAQTKSHNTDFHKLCSPEITIVVNKSKEYKVDVAFSTHGDLTNV
jgi:hypothetical protein